jgi:hypothetical protein
MQQSGGLLPPRARPRRSLIERVPSGENKAIRYLSDLFLALYSDGKQCIVFLNALIKAD